MSSRLQLHVPVLLLLLFAESGRLCLGFSARSRMPRARAHERIALLKASARESNEDSSDSTLSLPACGASSFDPSVSENRFAPVAEGKDLKNSAFVGHKFELQYTCKLCETRNSNRVSRIAYREGVVIVVCKGCMAKHLIADNLGWHNYIGGFEGEPDIEKYMEAVGREGEVTRVSQDVFELERMLGNSLSAKSEQTGQEDEQK